MELDPVIHQPVRLRILAMLHRNREARFTDLRDGLSLTPGNLQSHAKRLVAEGLIAERRVLAGVHFELRYRITAVGQARYRSYMAALRQLIEGGT